MIIHFVCVYLPKKFCIGCPPEWLKDVCFYLPKCKCSWHFDGCYATEFYTFLRTLLRISFPSNLTLGSRGLTSEVTKSTL